jgi:hypothetical protein
VRDFDWENLVKRYVWDDTRTPYFTRVARLNRVQACYELHAYAIFVGVLFAVATVAALSGRLPHGNAAIVPIYAFTVVCAAIVLGLTRHYYAAVYCAAAPLGALAYFAAYGFHPELASLDRVVMVVVVLAWLAYGLRVIAIARAYPSLPEPATPEPPRRR